MSASGSKVAKKRGKSANRAKLNRQQTRKMRTVESTKQDTEIHKLAGMTPGQKLKSLRERAGVMQRECARAIGIDTTSGYSRYENSPPYNREDDPSPIPFWIALKLKDVLVGRGHPPITWAELEDITDGAGASGLADIIKQTREQTKLDTSAFIRPQSPIGCLPIKYRAEREVLGPFVQSDKNYGASPICPSQRYAAEAQFAARVVDSHAAHLGLMPEDVVHVVGGMPTSAGSLVLAAIPQAGLYEIVAGEVEAPDSVRVSGKAFSCNILGAIVGKYCSL